MACDVAGDGWEVGGELGGVGGGGGGHCGGGWAGVELRCLGDRRTVLVVVY